MLLLNNNTVTRTFASRVIAYHSLPIPKHIHMSKTNQ